MGGGDGQALKPDITQLGTPHDGSIRLSMPDSFETLEPAARSSLPRRRGSPS